MDNHNPFPFSDYQRARNNLVEAVEKQELYLLLTGETGTGKTALVRDLRAKLDRCRYRVFYFAGAQKLTPMGLIRVLLRSMRVPSRCSHSERVYALVQALREEPQQVLLIFDEAHDLPDETLTEARSLVESDLDAGKIQVLLVGLPALREQLSSSSQLWRRIVVREEITGLSSEELLPFLEHHFQEQALCLCKEGLQLLFERGRGTPGLILPLFKTVLTEKGSKDKIDPLQLEDILQRWDLV